MSSWLQRIRNGQVCFSIGVELASTLSEIGVQVIVEPLGCVLADKD